MILNRFIWFSCLWLSNHSTRTRPTNDVKFLSSIFATCSNTSRAAIITANQCHVTHMSPLQSYANLVWIHPENGISVQPQSLKIKLITIRCSFRSSTLLIFATLMAYWLDDKLIGPDYKCLPKTSQGMVHVGQFTWCRRTFGAGPAGKADQCATSCLVNFTR